MSLYNATGVLAASSGLWLIYKLTQVGKREPYLPPGPPTVPLLGNLHTFPSREIHYQFTEWAKQYGEVYSLKIGPATAIVISSASAMREILEKCSALTSDRPPNHLGDLVADGKNIGLARYDSDWRKLRRGAHEVLTPQASEQHQPIQQAEATQLMYDLLTHPEGFTRSVRRYAFSVLLSVVYGKRAPRYETHEVTSFYFGQHLWAELLAPGAHPPMDLIPILKRVPERFAPWKTLSREVGRLQRTLYFGLFEEVERRMGRGESNGCYMETLCARAEEWAMNRELIGHVGGTLLEAGSDTTGAFLLTFILMLVAFPEVQKKGQEEVDRIIGSDRAPVLEDIEHLPYVQAIIKETHRFRPVAPLAIPHATSGDVMYKGYRIPTGTTLFMNTWGVYHDKDAYEDESVFNPDRYLKTRFGTREEFTKEYRDDFAFGSGRRACPGIHLAKNSISLNALNYLWGFNFGRAKDPKTGMEITPDVWDFAPGLAIAPNPFRCTISPRSQNHADIIQRQFAEAADAFAAFEHDLSDQDREFIEEQRKGL